MQANSSAITIEVVGGDIFTVAWSPGLTVHRALELAAGTVNPQTLSYAIQYYAKLGYLVCMINETYETFKSSADPFFYWEFFLNGQPASKGIDQTVLNNGDAVAFALEMYSASKHKGSTLQAKHLMRIAALSN